MLRVLRTLDWLIECRGKPKAIRLDNGPEFISRATQKRTRKHGGRLEYIHPQQSAYVESFIQTVCHEYLDMNEFRKIEARQLAEQRAWTYK